jgi:hypothetical protein
MTGSMTGRWLGRYEYPYGPPPVPFEADLIDEAGGLSGAIYEPNTFRPNAGPELSADITGSRTGAQVVFQKRYRGAPAREWPFYEGTVNSAFTRIEGRWIFHHIGLSGRFVMMRKPLATVSAAREVEAVV